MRRHNFAIKKLHQNTIHNYHSIIYQTILNIKGKAENPEILVGSLYDVNEMLPIHKEENDITALCILHYNLLFLNLLFENYPKALEEAELATLYGRDQISHPIVPLITFFDSITRLAVISRSYKR